MVCLRKIERTQVQVCKGDVLMIITNGMTSQNVKKKIAFRKKMIHHALLSSALLPQNTSLLDRFSDEIVNTAGWHCLKNNWMNLYIYLMK